MTSEYQLAVQRIRYEDGSKHYQFIVNVGNVVLADIDDDQMIEFLKWLLSDFGIDVYARFDFPKLQWNETKNSSK